MESRELVRRLVLIAAALPAFALVVLGALMMQAGDTGGVFAGAFVLVLAALVLGIGVIAFRSHDGLMRILARDHQRQLEEEAQQAEVDEDADHDVSP